MEKEIKNLIIKNSQGEEIFVLDSREVADMMGKAHKEIIWNIEGNEKRKIVGIAPTLQSANMHVADYFIESSYNDRGRIKKCYLITKMGCELLGNKQQGEKGILFSAKYVERFNQMEKQLKSQVPQLTKEQELALKIFNGGFTAMEAYKELMDIETKPLKKTIKDQEEMITDLIKKNNYLNLITDSLNTYSTREVAKHLGLKSERQLYKILINCKVIFKTKNGGYLLSGALENEGFNKYVTVVKRGSVVATQLKWTESGKLFIYDLLKEMEII